ncbi:rRNA maturation RNase YbeY [Sedimentibacter sp. zth1]|uniref:rRNA maturation RNase YbeY n=1 Tax=Sedimentibacter sp. zth1 TaxID=2816908 RepID=UPI001A91FAB5|nr:rRNA maturation RNase YbeY [Sedimentibacter sp. zth1]QSX06839.1 rRNA maturation RNase YbeY [Sedimentibacter sp. zth1]
MNVTVLCDNRQEFMKITDENIEAMERTIKVCIENENLEGIFEVSVSFVVNDEIKKLNNLYRNVDSATDVLSFPMDGEDKEYFGETIMLGDIVLSTEKIIEQAKEFGHSLERELLYLVTHSMLHLFGYDHIQEEDKSVMREKEKEIMKKLHLFK